MIPRLAHANSALTKTIYIIRHGQALHNPRAEEAKANGCSMDEFVSLMRQDDALDAELTELGKTQARQSRLSDSLSQQIQLVISSPLSRAIQTADLVLPPAPLTSSANPAAIIQRHCCELFREVNGDLLNAKRRTRKELEESFPRWNFGQISPTDNLWTETMEEFEACAERGYQGLCWLMDRPEECICLVSHGGILRYTMNIHPNVKLSDERTGVREKAVESRFDNCELRKYILSWEECVEENTNGDDTKSETRRLVLLTQID
jgi:broad specificity phosphatase PhoE